VNNHRTNKPRRGKFVTILIVGMLAAALTIGIAVTLQIRRTARMLLEAETRLQAVIVTADAVRAFAGTQDPPRWPASWDELATIQVTDHPWIHWPRDRSLMEEHVTVDFGADLEAVLAQPIETVNAIRPNGICFEGWQHDVWHALRQAPDPAAP
jgi:hypothetical protein